MGHRSSAHCLAAKERTWPQVTLLPVKPMLASLHHEMLELDLLNTWCVLSLSWWSHAGHSCWGILNAPATGEAMAELILDGKSHAVDISALSPARL